MRERRSRAPEPRARGGNAQAFPPSGIRLAHGPQLSIPPLNVVELVARAGPDPGEGALGAPLVELARGQTVLQPGEGALIAEGEVARAEASAERPSEVAHELTGEQGTDVVVLVLGEKWRGDDVD